MFIKEVMEKDVVTVSPSSSVFHASKSMAKYGVSDIIVTDQHKPVGILTAQQVCSKVVAKDKTSLVKVSEVMVPHVFTASPKDSSVGLAKIMKEEKVHLVPVVDKNNKLVGKVSYEHVVHHLIDEVEHLDEAVHHKDLSLKDFKTQSEKFMHEVEETFYNDVLWTLSCQKCGHEFLVKEKSKKKSCPRCKNKKVKVKK